MEGHLSDSWRQVSFTIAKSGSPKHGSFPNRSVLLKTSKLCRFHNCQSRETVIYYSSYTRVNWFTRNVYTTLHIILWNSSIQDVIIANAHCCTAQYIISRLFWPFWQAIQTISIVGSCHTFLITMVQQNGVLSLFLSTWTLCEALTIILFKRMQIIS